MRPAAGRLVTLVLILLAGSAPACRAPERRARQVVEPEQVSALIDRVLPAYVFVGGGSGAVISPDGYVITNAHVAGQSKRWRLMTADGAYHSASLVGVSSGTDLCLLKIDHAAGLPYLPLGDSDKMAVGDVVVAIGNPFALGNVDGKPTVTLGVVSALHVDRPHAYDAIQTDTPINPGNSGGPLINLKGELIGVNAQIMTRFGLRQNTGAGYAISSNQVGRFLPSLKTAEGKQVTGGRLAGLVLGAKLDEPAVVQAVDAGSDARKAGFKKGDVIFAFERAAVASVRDFNGVLGRYPIGIEVVLKVRRKGGAGQPEEQHTLKIAVSRYGRPYIGIKFSRKSHRSLAIGGVEPNSPAAKAGLKKGDVVVGLGRSRIRSRTTYYRLVYRLRPGITVPLMVRRGSRTVRVQLHVGERK